MTETALAPTRRRAELLLAFSLGCGAAAPQQSGAPAVSPAGATPAQASRAPEPPPPKRVRVMPGRGELTRFADPERARKIAAFAEAGRGELETELKALGAPGFAWGLVVDGELVSSGAAGTTRVDGGAPVTPSTVFRIGSITKVFTALAVLQLRDQGRLQLDAPARDWLPEFDGVIYPSADSPSITPRHLLLHHSGLRRLGDFDYTVVESPPTERDVLGALAGAELRDVPGVSFEYSNFGYALLGLLVARAAGQPLAEHVSERILQPLGMSHSVWAADAVPEALLARPHALGQDGALGVVPEWPRAASDGAGGLYSSVEDLARFAAFQLSAQPASSAPESAVLARSSLREAQSMQAVDRVLLRAGADQPPRAYVSGEGLGWAVYRDCRFEQVVWHNGGTEGHRAALYLLPTRGVAAIALANRDGVDLDAPARRLLERLHDASLLPRRQPTLVLNDAWREQVTAALALGRNFDRARFEALFERRTRELLTPERMQPFLEAIQREHGECRPGSPLQSRDERWQAAALECERGAPLILEAALSTDRQLIGLWIGSLEKHAERLRRRGGGPEAQSPCSD